MSNKYHRKSIRLKDYDYSQSAYYYVTICTHQREELFGKISDGNMELNEAGEMIKKWIYVIEEKYKECKIDNYVIMPNHIHFVLFINENCRGGVTPPFLEEGRETLPLQKITLGQMIGYFKFHSSKHINILRKSPATPLWQRNFYEHIIRNEAELQNIRCYIQNNPVNWVSDENNVTYRQ